MRACIHISPCEKRTIRLLRSRTRARALVDVSRLFESWKPCRKSVDERRVHGTTRHDTIITTLDAIRLSRRRPLNRGRPNATTFKFPAILHPSARPPASSPTSTPRARGFCPVVDGAVASHERGRGVAADDGHRVIRRRGHVPGATPRAMVISRLFARHRDVQRANE